MNRAQRRAEAARDRMHDNAKRVRKLVDERNEAVNTGEQFRLLLFAHVREHGRLVVRKEHLERLSENDRLDFVQRENGDVVVEYRAGT